MIGIPQSIKTVLLAEAEQIDRDIEILSQRKATIEQLIESYGMDAPGIHKRPTPRATRHMSTIAMAKTVIRNSGHPLLPREIDVEIKKTYGVLPAKTLHDMLWKRARAKKGFFKTDEGGIGVTEMLATIETVYSNRDPENVIALAP